MDELLTLDEAARLMRQPAATLRYWRHIGKGPRSAKLGSRIFYKKGECVAYVEAQFEDDARRVVA
ncbi:MAG TPA: helix-turn-helix domain-containing protein [Propionibacteriaceae bacterium]|jgi:hypothetical protein